MVMSDVSKLEIKKGEINNVFFRTDEESEDHSQNIKC